MDYSVIIPIHNCRRRGIDRLKWQLLSLDLQRVQPKTVFIPDSSDMVEFLENRASVDHWRESLKMSIDIHHFGARAESGGFNMPHLFNRGIERATTEFILCTGIDFMYDPGLFGAYLGTAKPDLLILKEVQMLPNMTITEGMIRKWSFGNHPKNGAGKWADGIQFAHRDLWQSLGGYDERIAGWGGMDNDLHQRAAKAGFREVWFRGGKILHQWHRTEKGGKADLEQSKRNWALRDDPSRPINAGCLRFPKKS